jgi:hypothetical protein
MSILAALSAVAGKIAILSPWPPLAAELAS